MKNSPTAAEDRPQRARRPPGARRSRSSTPTCAAAARPRRPAAPTRIDLGQFAAWCDGAGARAGRGRRRATLRRYAATLSDRRAVAATVARKLAALRAFYRALREHGEVAPEPGRPHPGAEAPAQRCRASCAPTRSPALLDRIPRLDAARAARPRAVRAGLRVRPARRGARHARRRRGRLRRRGGARRGQGRRRRAIVPDRRARAAGARPLPRARRGPALARRRRRSAALFLSKSGRRLSTSDVRRRLRVWARHAAVAGRRLTRTRCATRSRPTCSTAAPTCARSRSCSGTHRSRTTQIYTRVESARLKTRVRQEPSAGVRHAGRRSGDQRQSHRAPGPLAPVQGDRRRRRPASGSSSPTRRWSSTSPAAWPPGLPAHVEEADLISYGLVGLISAIERFDLDARDQVRDLRDHAHQGRDHRRAALARLGAALGARPRAARSSAPTPSSSTSCSARRPTRRWPTSSSMTVDEFQDALLQISNSTVAALDELWTRLRLQRRRRSRCWTRCTTRARRTRQRSWTQTELKDRVGRRDRAPARAREARDRALLLREPDAARDRRGPRRHRVARLAAAHEGRPAPALAPRRATDGATASSSPRARRRRRGAGCCPRQAASACSDSAERRGGDRHAHGRGPHPQRGPRRPPRQRQDLAARGAAVRGRRASTGSARVADGTTVVGRRARRAGAADVDLARRSARSSGRTARSTCSTRPASRASSPTRSARCASASRRSSSSTP